MTPSCGATGEGAAHKAPTAPSRSDANGLEGRSTHGRRMSRKTVSEQTTSTERLKLRIAVLEKDLASVLEQLAEQLAFSKKF
jgi:hypothetical protein